MPQIMQMINPGVRNRLLFQIIHEKIVVVQFNFSLFSLSSIRHISWPINRSKRVIKVFYRKLKEKISNSYFLLLPIFTSILVVILKKSVSHTNGFIIIVKYSQVNICIHNQHMPKQNYSDVIILLIQDATYKNIILS